MTMATTTLKRSSRITPGDVTALTLPDPEHETLLAIREQCRAFFDRRDEVIGVMELDAADTYRRQAGAIEKFVGNREGRDDVRRSARVLECAVGAALGKPERGKKLSGAPDNLSPDDRLECRLIYRYREVWESELVQRGLSRSQVLALIQRHRQAREGRLAGTATIRAADWQSWLKEQPLCDLLLTDPPYATDVEDIRTFAHDWLPAALEHVRPTGRAYVCIGAYPHELEAYLTADRGEMTLAQVLVWTYRNTLGPAPAVDYKQNWQAVLYFRGPAAEPLNSPLMIEQFSVQDINAPDGRRGDRYHAWQKPDALGERFVRHATKPGELVLDPFAGTGTFLLAAARLGRDGMGCDLDPDQVALCLERGCTRG
jgi:hypothetical protein